MRREVEMNVNNMRREVELGNIWKELQENTNDRRV